MSKCGVISGPYFLVFGLNVEIYSIISVFSPNTRKYGPEITQYLDTFHTVCGRCNESYYDECVNLNIRVGEYIGISPLTKTS